MPAHLARLQVAVSSLLQRDRLPGLSRFTDPEATTRSANSALGAVSAAIRNVEHQNGGAANITETRGVLFPYKMLDTVHQVSFPAFYQPDTLALSETSQAACIGSPSVNFSA